MGSEGGSGRVLPALLSPLFQGPQSAQAAAPGLPAPVLLRLQQALRRCRSRLRPRPPAAGARGLQTPTHISAALRFGLVGSQGGAEGPLGFESCPCCGCRAVCRAERVSPSLPWGAWVLPCCQPLCLCCPHVLARAGERGTQVGRGDVGPDVSWGWGWGSLCLTSLSMCYSWQGCFCRVP